MAKFQQFSFSVLVNGKPIREYRHQNRLWVEGKSKSSYDLLFHNYLKQSVLAIFSVDGLDVMTGKVPDLRTSPGYVVEPLSTLKVPGWRLDNTEVAKFVFGKRKDSYAEKTGTPQNVGVIGCAVFLAKSHLTFTQWPYPWYIYPCSGPFQDPPLVDSSTNIIWTTDSTGPCEFASSTKVEVPASLYHSTINTDVNSHSSASKAQEVFSVNQDLGTEFGERLSHKVTEVLFDRQDHPLKVVEIHYASKLALIEMGVINPEAKATISRAFPNEPSLGCTPPKDWNG